MSGFDVVGFGALNVDRLFKVNKIAGAEEEGFIKSCEEACGGSAANTIVGLARLGCKTGFIGKVANDREGKMLIEGFRREGVDLGGLIVAEQGRSGIVMGFVDDEGNRALYVDPGVNDTIEFDEIRSDYASQAGYLHLTSFVGEKSFRTQKRLIQGLPEEVNVTFDPGELYAAKGLEALEGVLRRALAVMPNHRELQLLTGAADYRRGAEILLGKGVKIVAVKLGGRGCYVTDGREKHHVEGYKVKVVDTTGAGDAFCAGFIYGLVKGTSLYECGKLGNFVASRCIMHVGARAGLPRVEDLEALN